MLNTYINSGFIHRDTSGRFIRGVKRVVFVLVTAGYLLTMCWCGSDDCSDVINSIPKGGYVTIEGYRPTEIARSEFFNRLTEHFQAGSAIANGIKPWKVMFDLEFDEIECFFSFESDNSSEDIYFLRSPVTLAKVKEKAAESPDGRFEERTASGREFIMAEGVNLALTEMGGGLLATSHAKVMERLLTEGDKMADSEEYRNAAALADVQASYFLLTWNKNDPPEIAILFAYGYTIMGEAFDPALAREVGDQGVGFGVSIYFAEGCKCRFRVGFDDEDFAARYYENLVTNRSRLVFDAGSLIQLRVGVGKSEAAFVALTELLSERMKFSIDGSVISLEMAFTLADLEMSISH